MAQETFDYSAMLADARAKRAALDAFIASLENAQAMGALGQSSGSSAGMSTLQASHSAVELPLGALMNKSVSNAIKLYLAACKKKLTSREIAIALKEGGVESTSKNFDIIVNNTLRNLKKAGVVLQFRDGWGLAELYPEGIRSRLAQQETVSKKTGRKAGKSLRKAKAHKAAVAAPGKEKGKITAAGIEAILKGDKAKFFSMTEIAAKLGSGTAGMQLTLGKMLKAERAEKDAIGRYRAFSGNVHAMPKAS
jgi:hypothetical protein